jgi:DNA repair photolyase
LKESTNDPVILDDAVFPFDCSNPACNSKFDRDALDASMNVWGIVYAEFLDAESKDFILIGVKCQQCGWVKPLRFSKQDRIIDLRRLLISPNPNFSANIFEQIYEKVGRQPTERDELLTFNAIPAWETSSLSESDLKEAIREMSFEALMWAEDSIPYFLKSWDAYEERAKAEGVTNRIRLRRLYPDSQKFRHMLRLISPPKAEIKIHNGKLKFYPRHLHPLDDKEKKEAWREFVEAVEGKTFLERAESHIGQLGYGDLDIRWFNGLVDLFLLGPYIKLLSELFPHEHPKYDIGFDASEEDYVAVAPSQAESNGSFQIEEFQKKSRKLRVEEMMTLPLGFEAAIVHHARSVYETVFQRALTESALFESRSKLRGWTSEIEADKALLIDAPMGVGKTTAILQGLLDNREMSAVIFLPTMKLCREVVENIELHLRNPGDEDGEQLAEVCFVYGITKEDCGEERFQELIKDYKIKGGRKYEICRDRCDKKAACRFYAQYEDAQKSRIVVTTHKQYDKFYRSKDLQTWIKSKHLPENGNTNSKASFPPRDVFIVDEDFVLSNCYQPATLEFSEFHKFASRFTEFLLGCDNHHKASKFLYQFYGQAAICSKTSLITPIDGTFEFPEEILTKWNQQYRFDHEFESEESEVEQSGDFGNYIDLIESAIRFGAVVERYGTRRRIHFPNTKSYDLSSVPPHVFLDGTLVDENLLERKMKNVKFKKIQSDVKPLWTRRVFQNVNSDLPAAKIARDQANVKAFISDLIKERGLNHKYLFLTNKATLNGYLKGFLEPFQNLDYVICSYGSMRGTNEARECDICVMLGSHNLSDAVEIASALELIHNKLPKNQVITAKPTTWIWGGSGKSRRVYRPEYAAFEQMANTLRRSEHRQGMGRTRYLYHPVDFYIISKDPVTEYEPFLPKSCVQEPAFQYRADILPPRKEPPNTEISRVREAASRLLSNAWDTRVAEISRKFGMRRGTVQKHLNQMVDQGELVKDGTRYSYPITTAGRRTLFSDKVGFALSRREIKGSDDIPFSLNLGMGCFMACRYCSSPIETKIPADRFFKEVRVKPLSGLPVELDHELEVYRDLPQHLKRIRINDRCESYHFGLMKKILKSTNKDFMAEILKVFEKHQSERNRWMLHVMTKSHLICRHIEILSKLKEMVQIEISFPCSDEGLRRKVERFAPSIRRRLDAVKQLSDAGLFVRIVAAPLVSDKKDALELRKIGLEKGARAFRCEGLQYFDVKDLIAGRMVRKHGKRPLVHQDMTMKSGETISEGGVAKSVKTLIPENWSKGPISDWRDKLVEEEMPLVNFGYSECNDADWAYIK